MIAWYDHPTDATLLDITVTHTQAHIVDLFDRRVFINDDTVANPDDLLARFHQIWKGPHTTLNCIKHHCKGELFPLETVPHAWAPLVRAIRQQDQGLPPLNTLPMPWQPVVGAIREYLHNSGPLHLKATCLRCHTRYQVITHLHPRELPLVQHA